MGDASSDRVPSTSIVVVNKLDPAVGATLDALRQLTEERTIEVIVVDASRRRLEPIRQTHPWATWIDYVHPSGKPRTIAEQRNIGLRATSGQVVIFLDAGCIPAADWLPSLLQPIQSGEEQIVVGGVRSKGRSTVHDRRAVTSTEPCYLTECSTMNLAVAKSVFDLIGAFDERLGFAEDVDFSWRAVDAGLRLRYVDTAAVTHDWGSAAANVERAVRYGVARVRLYRKHPEQLRRLLGPDFSVAAYSLFVAFLPVALFVPWYLLLLVIPLVRNRGRRPVAMLGYQLCYGAGVLSELLHVPILKGQRRRFVPELP